MKCATHPDVETSLACSKCGKPICPRCLVQTPVGARCRDCARADRLPTYALQPTHYLKAIGVMVVVSIAAGFAWVLAEAVIPFLGIFNIMLAGGVGYVIAELVSRAVNRKRGPVLAVIASIGVLMAYVTTIILPFGHFFPGFGPGFLFDLIALVVGIVVAVGRLR